MEKFIAKIISTIFNPLLILVPVPYILIIKTTGNQNQAYFWTIFTLIFIIIFFLFVLVGIEKGYFSDLDVSKRKQRFFLYSFAIALSAFYSIFLYFLKAPEVLFIAVFGIIMGIFLIEAVNKVTKASVHVGMIAAFATSLVLGFGPLMILTFVFIPLVAWARIKTKNHTKKQTVIGAVLGVLTTLVVYVIFKYII